MHTKTMEGLIGARTNMNMTEVPMRVFKEARRKGDTATMERAMGYVNDFQDRAYDYKDKADEGMKEEAKEDREKEKLEREQALEKRREERRQEQAKLQEQIQETHAKAQTSPEAGTQNKADNTTGLHAVGTDKNTQEDTESSRKQTTDTVEISPEGQALYNQANNDGHTTPKQPSFYSSAGVAKRMEQTDTSTLNVSV